MTGPLAPESELRSSSSPAGLRHEPALDGLRGVAVLLVLLYHGGVAWAGGGFLGVEVFFVLSGFLITSLLLAESARTGRIDFAQFWARRGRRLLPALFLVVLVCAIYEAVVGPTQAVPDFGADALSTLFYVANWHQLWVGSGYFAQVSAVSPLQHTWSLGIEEQFYLTWPILLALLLGLTGSSRITRKRSLHASDSRRRLRLLLSVTVAGVLASAVEMSVLYGGGSGLDRVYYGTDTRAQSLLTGAALATVMALRHGRRSASSGEASSVLRADTPARAHVSAIEAALAAVGALGAIGLALAVARASGNPSWIYHFGFLGIDLACAAVIVSVVSAVRRRSPVRALLAVWPLRAVGLISYGLYLWHFPLYLWLTADTTGVSGSPLLALRLAASVGIAVLSYFVVEQPIRTRRLSGFSMRLLAPIGTVAVLSSVAAAWAVSGASAGALPSGGLSRVPQVTYGPIRADGHVGRHVSPGPLRAMIIGDSIGLTLGIELAENERRYDVDLLNETVLGCGFIVKGESDEVGTNYGYPKSQCLDAVAGWHRLEETLHPEVVLVEMGYWDEMNWLQDGQVTHIGVPRFDAELRSRMDYLVRTLASARLPVVFLTVPWVDPLPWPNGSEPFQASPVRHVEINDMLASLPRSFPGRAFYFDTSPYLTPGNRYRADVGGGLCRMADGIHFALGPSPNEVRQTPCGAALQAALFPYLRRLAAAHHR